MLIIISVFSFTVKVLKLLFTEKTKAKSKDLALVLELVDGLEPPTC